MTFLTIFLARFIGLYCVAIALAMWLRRRETVATINAMAAKPELIMLSGVIALAGGLACVLGHNMWSGGALSVAVTCVGWVVLAKGVLLLALPAPLLRRFFQALHYEALFPVYMGATLLLGVA